MLDIRSLIYQTVDIYRDSQETTPLSASKSRHSFIESDGDLNARMLMHVCSLYLNSTCLFLKAMSKLYIAIGLKRQAREPISELLQRNMVGLNDYFKVKSSSPADWGSRIQSLINKERQIQSDTAKLIEESILWLSSPRSSELDRL